MFPLRGQQSLCVGGQARCRYGLHQPLPAVGVVLLGTPPDRPLEASPPPDTEPLRTDLRHARSEVSYPLPIVGGAFQFALSRIVKCPVGLGPRGTSAEHRQWGQA